MAWGFLGFLIFIATHIWNGRSSVMGLCYEAVIFLACCKTIHTLFETAWAMKAFEIRKKVQKKASHNIFLMTSWKGKYLDRGGEIRSLVLAPVLRQQWHFLEWLLPDSFSSLSRDKINGDHCLPWWLTLTLGLLRWCLYPSALTSYKLCNGRCPLQFSCSVVMDAEQAPMSLDLHDL